MKHRLWHWWFTNCVSIPYKFKTRWYGSTVVYRDNYCSICKKVVSKNYEDEE